MDATRRSSSKRKHLLPSSPSRPLLQITTGSSTKPRDLFPHPIRTVHLRSDAASDADDDLLVISDLCKKAKLNQESSVKNDGQPSCVPIKDLRARRVYSPQSVGGSCANSSQNVDDEQSKAGSSCRDQKMADSGFGSAPTKSDIGPAGEISKRNGECRGNDEIDSILCSIVKEYLSEKNNDLYLDEALDSRKEETESPVAGFACETQNLGYVNNESLDEGQKSQNASDISKLTTPPDVEICGNFKINEDERRQVEDIHVKNAQLTGKAGENKEEPFCPKADFKGFLERKTVRTCPAFIIIILSVSVMSESLN